MMAGTTISLASHVDQMLRKYRRGIPVVSAVVVSFAFGGCILFSSIRTDGQTLRAIDAHVASLVETQDRPELQRLVKSIGDEKAGTLQVVEGGIVVASSHSISDLDRPYQEPRNFNLISGSSISSEGLLTQVSVHRPHGPKETDAKLVMLTPLTPLVFWSAFVALFVLNVGLLIGSRFGERLRQTIELALGPVGELDNAIRSLDTLDDPSTLKRNGIRELDSIRDAILETHEALVNARDALAEQKAKELAAEAYRRLIHDLHNPIAALRTLVKVANLPSLTAEERASAADRIPYIAEQILSQINSAKSNIDFEAKILKDEDIRTCVSEATDQAKLASPRLGTVEIESQIPEEPVVFPHDATLLNRAVSNLVKNAMDACRTRVRVVVKKVPSGASIQVLDDGPGISEEKVGLYLQGRSKSTKGDRQAFGLAAANHIVRAHGGRIIYRASEFGGACFEIRI
jgi:signal transduction histidine kinase